MAKRARQTKYQMKIEEPVYVPMRDGVRIALRVYRPDAEGEFPALFAASPYQFETDDLPHSSMFLWPTSTAPRIAPADP